MVFHDHGHAQELVAVGGNLPGNYVGAAAQAPGLDDLDFLLGPFGIRGGAAAGLGALGGLAAAGAAGTAGVAAAGRQAQDHEEGEGERHQFFHRFFLLFMCFL